MAVGCRCLTTPLQQHGAVHAQVGFSTLPKLGVNDEHSQGAQQIQGGVSDGTAAPFLLTCVH
jgi:hypothetical protein